MKYLMISLLSISVSIGTSGCRTNDELSAENASSQTCASGTSASSRLHQAFEIAKAFYLPSAHAGTWGPDESTLLDLANDSTLQLMHMQVLNNVRSSASGHHPPSTGGNPDITIGARPTVSVAIEMAKKYPASQQKDAKAYLCKLLQSYESLETQLGLKHYDLSAGIAAFISGNYFAYTGNEVQDAHVKALALQIKNSISKNAALAKVSRQDVGRTYEQLVIYGMNVAVMAKALQQQPDPQQMERMKQNAKSQLESYFEVNADKIVVNAKGVSILP
jgi:hypothetical protein